MYDHGMPDARPNPSDRQPGGGSDRLQGLKRDKAVREIVRAWRYLTGEGRDRGADRRTLIACSGGVDSSALAIALASASRDLVVAHIVHDMRSRVEAMEDRDATASLAHELGLPFAENEASGAQGGGNIEATLRRSRYAALEALALERHCRFVATGHHAGDQLETMLLALTRGAGPSGLGAIRAIRAMAPAGAAAQGEQVSQPRPMLIRPMLGVTPEDCARICTGLGWRWRVDSTNSDSTRARAAVRASVVPALLRIRPMALQRAVDAARVQQELADDLRERAEALLARGTREDGGIVLERADARRTRGVVIGEALRIAARSLGHGAGMDRLRYRTIHEACELIRSASGDAREVTLGPVRVSIGPAQVRIEVKKEAPG